ncbi:MAG: NYN domain-containing protein [Coriobacteriia bacterium]|nr:NYN domain-containing protein [Coriobacteriia bacterium]
MRVAVIDGYNVLRGSTRYRQIVERDMDAARDRLVTDIASWAAEDFEACVVFDGAANPHPDGSSIDIAGVRVMYSGHGIDADSVIETIAARHRRAGDEVLVVTSDAQTQWTTMGTGVVRMSAAEFGEEISGAELAWSEQAQIPASAQRIEDRIDPDVRNRLTAWLGRKAP